MSVNPINIKKARTRISSALSKQGRPESKFETVADQRDIEDLKDYSKYSKSANF